MPSAPDPEHLELEVARDKITYKGPAQPLGRLSCLATLVVIILMAYTAIDKFLEKREDKKEQSGPNVTVIVNMTKQLRERLDESRETDKGDYVVGRAPRQQMIEGLKGTYYEISNRLKIC